MADIQIPELPEATTLNSTDYLHVRQGATDKKVTITTLKSGLTISDVGGISNSSQLFTTAPITGGGLLTSGLNIGINAASTSAKGAVELATNAETQTGTDATRAVTPAALNSLTASVTRAGLVEMATDAEASAGTDTTRYVNPKQLKDKFNSIQAASTTVAGLLRVATNAEVSAAALNNVALSPLNLKQAFLGSKTENGYMWLPNGWLIQWGRYTGRTSEGNITCNFPIAFPNACLSIQTTVETPNGDSGSKYDIYEYQIRWKTNTQFNVQLQSDRDGFLGNYILMFALGH